MHDPETLAIEIKSPRVYRRTTMGDGSVMKHRHALISVWHHDPETDGSDDSCGFTVPKLTKKQLDRLRSFAWSEARDPYFMRCPSERWGVNARVEAESIYRGLVLQVAQCIGVRISFDRAARYAAVMVHRADIVDGADALCFLPGYHSNFTEDRREDRERRFLEVTANLARWLLADLRPWYRHPRWHVHHWRVVVHPWRDLMRWLFTRCAQCRKGFGWPEEVTGYSWDGGGPVVHHRCAVDYETSRAADRLIDEMSTAQVPS